MTSRRTFLIAGTGALAASVGGCGAGSGDATPIAAAPPPAGPAVAPPSSPVLASTTPAADWLARSTAAGVVVAYDFSTPPPNGGTYQWGSLKASPKITCYGQNESRYGATPQVSLLDGSIWGTPRSVDTTVYPPGSTASMKWEVADCPTSGAAERGDLWWISLDNYADQFDDTNNEFWVQWRTRMNETYASFLFEDHGSGGNGVDIPPLGITAFKQIMMGEGMQTGEIGMTSTWPYGYDAVTAPRYSASNQINGIRVDFEGETNLIGEPTTYVYNDTTSYGLKYPAAYHGKPGYVPLHTPGSTSAYTTYHNSGNEAQHSPAACEVAIGIGYTDVSTCFIYPVDEWFTMMMHVKLGPRGHALSSLALSYRDVPARYVGANQIMLYQDFYTEHFNGPLASGLGAGTPVIHVVVKGPLTGSVNATVSFKDNSTGDVLTFTSTVAGATSGTLTTPYSTPGTYMATFADAGHIIRSVTISGTSVTWTGALPPDTVTTAHTAGGNTLTFNGTVAGASTGTLSTPHAAGTFPVTFDDVALSARIVTVASDTTTVTWSPALPAQIPSLTMQLQQALLTLDNMSGTIYNEPLTVDEHENGFTNSTIEYYGAYAGQPMQLLHKRTGVVMRVGNFANNVTGYTPTAKYGTFAWTTFMTNKSYTQRHPVAKVWISQIIIKAGATAPATPAY